MALRSEWLEQDYYQILGVAKDADAQGITRAYRQLAKRYHPDVNPGKEDQFKAVAIAYEVLSDPAMRKEYDTYRAVGPSGNSSGVGGSGSGNNWSRRDENLGDFIGDVFNRKRKPQAARTPASGGNIEAEAHIGFEEAANGVTISLGLDSDVACGNCGGTGSEHGAPPVVCPKCQGSGSISVNQGFFAISIPCPDCSGRGEHAEKICESCHGVGAEHRKRQVKVRIPPGVHDGSKIRIKRGGNAGRNGGSPGDLLVTVHVSSHRLFTQKGSDLLLTVPVTFAEAVLGAAITVPGIDGRVSLDVPAGAKSGLVLRARGKGLPRRGKGDRGDLLVTIEIDVPKDPTDGQTRAVKAFTEATPESPRKYLEDQA